MTVIVEAGETSGSIYCGREALRLGRGLFISENLTVNPSLTWPAKMLKRGAKVFSDGSLPELFKSQMKHAYD